LLDQGRRVERGQQRARVVARLDDAQLEQAPDRDRKAVARVLRREGAHRGSIDRRPHAGGPSEPAHLATALQRRLADAGQRAQQGALARGIAPNHAPALAQRGLPVERLDQRAAGSRQCQCAGLDDRCLHRAPRAR
jgi:hypothetical protein